MFKRNSIKILSSLAVAGVLLTACSKTPSTEQASNAQEDHSLEQVKKNGVLRVAVFADDPPFGYVDSAGNNQGFDVALAKRVTKDLLGDEKKVEFIVTEASNRVEFLKSNRADVVFATFTVTPERKEVVDFAEPYLKGAFGIVSPKAKPITDITQLEGKTLIVNKGTSSDTYFTKHYPKVNLLKFERNSDAFKALTDGRGDAISQDSTYALAWAAKNPSYVAGIQSIGDQEFIAPAVKKGNTQLLNWLNTEIKQLRTSGEIKKIYDETLKPIYGDSVNPNVFLDVGQ
ncbi:MULTISPECIES: transporter substrate-binding domain-containing protein [Acinetobacter]|uniref:transporter substrate-binding domain-containing protein n=1 Tax=Acinetobacter TaxID=469 RepID=UPI0008393262|nr:MULTISPECIES: transporter substrate-binding domain-containing protein [Acinetobacter]AQV16254.1 glutamine-binding protein [Acinetobacter pittii]MBP1483290.1 transporter substrate-binding domain-containing protein [Acinetobacter nosocomialis]OCY52283.1 glutamine-binding protein [Acinetobacter pittii]PTV48432.1 glutamine-binding protein [Acinetobacter oleivorans]